MRQVRGVGAARKLLRRTPLEAAVAPAQAARGRELFGQELTPEQVVDRIIAEVAARGDEALLDYTRRIDGVKLSTLQLPQAELTRARGQIDAALLAALEQAAERLRSFHRACLPKSWFDEESGLGQRILPLDSVGMYVPGGTAAYPSTVLHVAIPAKVAGVESLAMASPPLKDGSLPAPVLAAAAIAGVDRVYRVGGAQAIAAMALGTESIQKVDKIVGPGNIFVTLAKGKLFGVVGIDGFHGPTETMIIADDTAEAGLCAADLLAQAEHDVLATPIFVTTSERLAHAVPQEVERQVATLERVQIAKRALDARGVVALVPTIDDAIDLANEFAPEHLCLLVEDAAAHADKVRHSGGLFLGESSPEVLGDYNAGPSHVMPTGGTARFGSALGVHDFVKVTSVIGLRQALAVQLSEPAARIARAEGLTAHARAAELRLRRATKSRDDVGQGERLKRTEDG